MVELNNLPTTKTNRKRLGRGESSGIGKTSGKGSNGQRARSKDMPKGFEGGQTPLKWRLPKIKGFKRNIVLYEAVSLKEINRKFKDGEKVNPKTLLVKKLISSDKLPVKIIGDKLTKKLVFEDVLYSVGAKKLLGMDKKDK
jgi:large subunit ribosomal protein L15